MTNTKADVVICGAGIAGIAAAYHLVVKQGMKNVVLVDERPPLTLTSDKSTEAYRNWWPGPDEAMIRLMNRSIDMLETLAEESGNIFLLNRRGYLYATADPTRVPAFRQLAAQGSALGAGPVRYHTGQPNDPTYVPSPAEEFRDQPSGADLILDPALIRRHFSYFSERTIAALHVRRCGWLSGQQLGMYLLEQVRERGGRFLNARVEGVTVTGGRVQSVQLARSGSFETISTRNFVNAAGPLLKQVGAMVGVDLPVFSELHLKVSFKDHLGVIPREAPMLIWEDPQSIPWREEERNMLAESEETKWLLEEFPPSVHTRPEGSLDSQNILVLWPYHLEPVEAVFPLPENPFYPELVLRGMSAMLPGLKVYLDQLPKPFVDGGYYTKTRENRFLSGPLPLEGAFVIGALSGYGLMAACGAGELLAAHVTGNALPPYAGAFSLERYENPAYRKLLENWGSTAQL